LSHSSPLHETPDMQKSPRKEGVLTVALIGLSRFILREGEASGRYRRRSSFVKILVAFWIDSVLLENCHGSGPLLGRVRKNPRGR
jgi:hypothetical protein